MSTQTAVRPVAQQLEVIAQVHRVWLDQITSKAGEYTRANADDQKRLAASVGKSSVAYIEAMGKVVRNMSDSAQAKEAVNLMNAQIKGVKTQLTDQLANLKIRLQQIQTRLEAEEAELTKLQVGFWVSLVATIARKYFTEFLSSCDKIERTNNVKVSSASPLPYLSLRRLPPF